MPDQLEGPINKGDRLLWIGVNGEYTEAVQVIGIIDLVGQPLQFRLRGFKQRCTMWPRDVPEDHLRKHCRRYA